MSLVSLGWLKLIFWLATPCFATAVTPTLTLTPIPTTALETQLYLSELLSKPGTGDEWIELYNPNEFPVNLAGWQLWDELANPSLIFNFTAETILAEAQLVIPINRKLNDSEDGVKLKNPQGVTVDATHYFGSPVDLSWSRLRFNSEPPTWNFQSPSPNLANPIPTSSPTSSPTSTATITITSTTTLAKLTQPSKVIRKSAASLKPRTANLPDQKPVSSPSPLLILSPPSPIKLGFSSSPTSQKSSLSQPFDAIMIGWWLMVLTSWPILIYSPNPSQ